VTATFVGRTQELARLGQLPAGALATLWGPGGVGKTRLAREHAELERRRGRAVTWVDLAGTRTRREVMTAIATSLGVAPMSFDSDDSASDDDAAALGRAVCARRALLVADNLEQLDAPARAAIARLASVVAAEGDAGGANVLVTSRELLGAPHEVAIAIEPLGEDDGVALFEALAGSPSPAARMIVRRLDALPLAIELAAARVPLLGATELLARLDRKLDVLGTAKADRPARHATLRAAIAWSWDLLDDGDRAALAACATFEAPFDAGLAEAVIGGAEADALDRLERLRGRALIHAATDEHGLKTLRLLESVRDFARESSEPTPSSEPTEHLAGRLLRHAAAVVARCEPFAEDARCGKDTLAPLEARRADLVAAARHAGPLMARATLALATLLAISGPASEAVRDLDRALEANATGDADPTVRARLLVAKGDALRAVGRLAEARAALLPAVALARDLGDSPGARLIGAEAARILGSIERALGCVQDALAHKEAALATYRAIGDRAREGICLGEIGAVHQSEGRLADAKACHAEAIAIHVATGSRRAEGVDRSYLAVATHRAGDPAAAIALHEQALAIHRDVGHRRLEGAELLHLGFVHHELGALATARTALAEARRVLVAAGARGLEAMALVFAARLEVDAGDATTALLRLAEAAQVAPASWPRVAATRHLVEGHLAMATGAPARAVASYEAALATSRDLEVGFEALTPAYLAVALTRASTTTSAATPALTNAVNAHLADAGARLATLDNPHLRVALDVLAAIASGASIPEAPASAAAASSEVRRALALSTAAGSLTIESGGKRVVLPDGRVLDLSRRKNVRLVLLELARARRDAPGCAVSPDALLAAGWPGERMRPDAATKRLHTAIWTLRSVGFETLLLTEGDGYLLDPRTDLVLPTEVRF
jgi:predicted ATPase